MHAVGINQSIGRITGKARPDLKRKLYTTHEIYNTFLKYNRNQEKYIEMIKNGECESQTKDIIEGGEFEYYKRDIDRKKLELKMNMVKEDTYSIDIRDEDFYYLIDKWLVENNINSKMFRYILSFKDGVHYDIIVSKFEEFGSISPKSYANDLTNSNKDKIHNKIYEINSDKIINIRKKYRDYCQTL
jgi:hypothetical protein